MFMFKTSPTNCVHLNRDELQDKFFRLKEEHLVLKKEANNAEHQLKCLNVKLSRLINEKKRLVRENKTKREVELEELCYDLQEKAYLLERDNIRLKERCLVLKTQLNTNVTAKQRNTTQFSQVRSRTDSGLNGSFSWSTSSNRLIRGKASSTLSLNRVSFVASNPSNETSHFQRPFTAQGSTRSGRKVTGSALTLTKRQKPFHQQPLVTPDLLTLDLLKEAEEEIKRLEDIVAIQQGYVETLFNEKETLEEKLKGKVDQHLYSRPQERSGYLKNGVENGMNRINNGVENTVSNELILQTHEEHDLDQEAEDGEMEGKMNAKHRRTGSVSKKMESIQKIELEKENEILRESLEKCIKSCLLELNGSTGKDT